MLVEAWWRGSSLTAIAILGARGLPGGQGPQVLGDCDARRALDVSCARAARLASQARRTVPLRPPSELHRRRRGAARLCAARAGARSRRGRHARFWRPARRAHSRRGAGARPAIAIEFTGFWPRFFARDELVQRSRAATALDWLALALVVLAAVIRYLAVPSLRLGGDPPHRSKSRSCRSRRSAVVALRAAIDRRTRRPCWLHAPALARSRIRVLSSPSTTRARPLRRPGVPWRHGMASPRSAIARLATVLLFPQLQRMDSVPDLGDPLLSIWRSGWVVHKLGGDPAALQPEHLLSASADVGLFGFDAAAGTHDRAFSGAGSAPGHCINVVMVLSFIASAFALYCWRRT